MIPAEFDYVAPESLDAALAALRDGGEDAKVLAGGHSLVPLMKLRLAAPTLLVDLGGVPGLTGIERSNGGWRIGAMTPHSAMERETALGLASKVASTIAGSATVTNAVIDALKQAGVTYINMPLSPMRIWQAIEDAKGGPA